MKEAIKYIDSYDGGNFASDGILSVSEFVLRSFRRTV
jgi:hypothetical protein